MEVLFNLHQPDMFAVANSNVSFYNVVEEYGEEGDVIGYGTKQFLSKNTDINTDVKCIAWHPSVDYSDIIAFGQSNGRVSLQSADFELSKPHLTGEYAPRHSRQCTGLAWNKFAPHCLAIGLEKSRSCPLVIWDVNSKSDFSQGSLEKGKQSSELSTTPNSQSATKPLLELASGESVNSLAWFTQETLIAGLSKKSLAIYDIRSTHNSPTSSLINHKATFGICPDPNMENRFACYGNTLISVWDTRNFSKPVVSIPTRQNVAKIEWSPVRSGMLAVLFATSTEGTRGIPGSDVLHVYEILNATLADHELEVAGYQPIVRTVKPKMPVGDWISGFAWIPTVKNYLLAASNVSTFHFCRVSERTSVCWQNQNKFAVSQGPDTFMIGAKGGNFPIDENTQSSISGDNVCSIIYKRVKNGYGISEDSLDKNIELSLEPENKPLHSMWRWIDRMKRLAPSPHAGGTTPLTSPQSPGNWTGQAKSRSLSTSKHHPSKQKQYEYLSGVQNILKDSPDDAQKATVETIPWIGVPSTKSKVYTSNKRAVALLMCDWGNTCGDDKGCDDRFGRNSVGEGLVRRLQLTGATERACAIALWHLDMKLALEVLNLASKNTKNKNHSTYSAVAMALSGYTGLNCPTLWLDTCRKLQKELESPYLQLAFAFLVACSDDSKSMSGEDRKFDLILSNKDILLQDRVAFACIYLPDGLLSTYVNSLADDVVSRGALDGVLVVGLSTLSGVKLLQQYIDNTGDLQTPLVAVVHTHQPFLLQRNHDVQHWKTSYAFLLNKWKLYFERVDFDLLWTKAANIQKTSSQVYIHCNYCNKNISNATVAQASRGRGFIGGGFGYQNSVMGCPSCRKPLPRCSVCSMHLGTRHNEQDLSKWISWCTRCRHGGHQSHLKEWFQEHIRCPVTDCNCCCMSPMRPQAS